MTQRATKSSPFTAAAVLVGFLGMLTAPASAMFAPPEAVPVDRLVKNLARHVAEHPASANAHYTLGRAHYMAVVFRSAKVGIYDAHGDNEKLPTIADRWLQKWALKRGNDGKEAAGDLPTEQLVQHHARAIKHLNRAVKIAPKKALYHLTLASAHEQGEAVLKAAAETRPAEEAPADRQNKAIRQAVKHYKRAYELAIDEDLARERQPVDGLRGLISHEAATGYLRLAEQVEGEDDATIARVRADLNELKKKPRGPITPVIFSLDGPNSIDELLAEKTTVTFDLDGEGRAGRWAWVKPDTGILVWDPHETGRIRSGRQLFGNVTWWLFWDTGYEALAALDDDGDGKLRGDELAGIAGWFDRDQDGVSDSGEVTPVRELGIKAIAVEATAREGRHPMNRTGMYLDDGRTVPTWDWVAEPAQSSR